MPKSLEFEPYTTRLVGRKTDFIVRSGPFRGMKYIRKSCASVLAPKLLGIYERELHKIIERVVSHRFKAVIDIGAAEGYYCAGLALRMPETRFVAYEIDDSSRNMLQELATLNQVADRIAIRGTCTIEEMNSVLDRTEHTCVICDVEGAEAYLLDPLRVPALRDAFILVELHDFVIGGLSEVIRSRFEVTHDIEQICAEVRNRSEFPFKTILTQCFDCYPSFAVSDCRPRGMSWYWMRPKSQAELAL
jgi:hypothetical protein